MERHGLKPAWWTVIRSLNYNLIVKNKLTGEVKYWKSRGALLLIWNKKEPPAELEPLTMAWGGRLIHSEYIKIWRKCQ